ncbi:hypothetical protein A9Q84_09845 [Halobacteriovorax marinus]|uniref:Uncharacterized protein n=1 Tax=Halobacteriovorax marinus TaxID=97084 RepID=A0A1Y5F6W7_9BACT|nr:hypothetical protein A9Q84_09845 [Halobacteriovorax marinus]
MSKIKIENYVDALLETSSIAAHDISGQIHVMQFCVDELETHLKDSGVKYITKLQSSLDELTELITLYRVDIRNSSLSKKTDGAAELVEKILSSVQVHFFNEFKKINFDLSDLSENLNLNISREELQSVLFSLLTIYLEELKKGQIEPCTMRLGLKVLDSEYCKFTLESKYSVDKKIFEKVDDSSSPGAKIYRKNLGHFIILNSGRYEVDSEIKGEDFLLSMTMKILNG